MSKKISEQIIPVNKLNPIILEAIKRQFPNEDITAVRQVKSLDGKQHLEQLFVICKD